jgi:hypothetical protein
MIFYREPVTQTLTLNAINRAATTCMIPCTIGIDTGRDVALHELSDVQNISF